MYTDHLCFNLEISNNGTREDFIAVILTSRTTVNIQQQMQMDTAVWSLPLRHHEWPCDLLKWLKPPMHDLKKCKVSCLYSSCIWEVSAF